jgi:hypothetical protein
MLARASGSLQPQSGHKRGVVAERNLEGTKADSRFEFGHRPEFTPEIGYAGFVGARPSDEHPFRTYRAVAAAAILFAAITVGVLLLVFVH